MPTAAANVLASVIGSGTLRRFTGSTQAVYTTLIVLCADGPRSFSAEQIAHLSGLGVRTAERGLSALIEARLIECQPFKHKGAKRYTGRYTIANPPL